MYKHQPRGGTKIQKFTMGFSRSVKKILLPLTCAILGSHILIEDMVALLECEAGYYKTNTTPPRCEMCTGNTIKTTVGDAGNCDADQPCDGIKTIPNNNHTACGNFYQFTSMHITIKIKDIYNLIVVELIKGT